MPDLTVLARTSLLDALVALSPHLRSLVVVGAQAVYVRAGSAYPNLQPFTTDGDLLVDPAFLAADPNVGGLMTDAGFRLVENDVGTWRKDSSEITVDLLVPESVGGAGRRGARLGPHGNRVAKKVPGLEGALVDRDLMIIRGEGGDERALEVLVAGAGALVVSKAFKLRDRREDDRRLDNKDALDVYRLLLGTPAGELIVRLEAMRADARSGSVAATGIALFAELFGSTRAPGVEMVVDAVSAVDDDAFVAASCSALAREVLDGLREPS